MQKKKDATKKKIVNAAWRLFYEQGYENTTIDEIVTESGTSRGSFYHYFDGKDSVLESLSFMFDEKYEELVPQLDEETDSFDQLMYLNQELFRMIENTIPIDLLARMYSTQLVTRGDKHLLDHNRIYYRVIRKIVVRGQEKGELRNDRSANDISKLYALCERALLYDWCICNGEYSLHDYAKSIMPSFLKDIRSTGSK